MSECVVRMEMPKNCINCDLRYECNAFYAPGKPKPFMKGCMIVCQLPEGHGRMVDADVLYKKRYIVEPGDILASIIVVDACYISGAKTIVPAEKEG